MSKAPNQKVVNVTIYQADYDDLTNAGLYMRIHEFKAPFAGSLPKAIYHSVFKGSVVIELPERVPENFNEETYTLEKLFMIFNINHPADYRSRSLSVGDVVELNGKLFFCSVIGYKPVSFVKEWPAKEGGSDGVS